MARVAFEWPGQQQAGGLLGLVVTRRATPFRAVRIRIAEASHRSSGPGIGGAPHPRPRAWSRRTISWCVDVGRGSVWRRRRTDIADKQCGDGRLPRSGAIGRSWRKTPVGIKGGRSCRRGGTAQAATPAIPVPAMTCGDRLGPDSLDLTGFADARAVCQYGIDERSFRPRIWRRPMKHRLADRSSPNSTCAERQRSRR
jgi:hypothetical protein